MEQRILATLERIEWEYGVDILYACESGSRAWGFVSPNSDYDVRFIYVHPLDHYLSVGRQRDVIEEPIIDDLDINGWDLRKALGLMRGSNPSLLEWLHSPVVYHSREWFEYELRELALQSLDRRALFHHYRSMAGNDWRKVRKADREVPLKRYFYMLRTALCALWVMDPDKPAMPPVAFAELLAQTDMDAVVRATIGELQTLKASLAEKCSIPRVVVLDDFLADAFARMDAASPEKRAPMPLAPFDQLLINTVRAA
ncbi:nucleotidyltransferase domain-containing protein [Gynuella sunshinyii]|uniref:Putative nucleotidyltransferase n=1 Tax=Gynuella sunshinyii YC6258 TaxID=1445510 RepID=A0A0C5VQH7_9GAMM|nr:nucleotidyltransferase domain-containing protein [Gynuella sunshinyii]AJQ92529.1 putative nucleotidyltransferase [Gynuella sunshinyii YC6258]